MTHLETNAFKNTTLNQTTDEPRCPLTTESEDRFVMFPIKDQAIWQMYKKHESTFWVAEEIDLSKDLDHWYHRMNDNERHYIKNVLAFFTKINYKILFDC